MKMEFEHNNVPQKTLEGITNAISRTLQSWHHNVTVKYDTLERLQNDISMSLYRFKEFVSFDNIKLLPDAPKELQGRLG